MQIERTEDASRGAYRVAGGDAVAEMTYSVAGTQRIIIDHTEVPDAFRGQGVGKALVERAVADARTEGRKVLPLCPFAAAQFRRNPDWADVLDRGGEEGRS